MTRKLKPVETELDEALQAAVLSLPVELSDGTVISVGGLVKRAEESLLLANAAVQENALIQTTAEFLMKQEKRRGNPSILVRMDGKAVLRISYDEEGEEDLIPPPAPTSRKSSLPTLDELREKAIGLNVDISDLGRKKKEIIARLARAEEGKPPDRLRDEVSESEMPPKLSLPGRNR